MGLRRIHQCRPYPWAGETSVPGFERPTVTNTPDALFDYWLVHLGGAELRVLLYAIRHTYGWKRPSDDIAIEQFRHGITTAEGKLLDEGTGLARSSCLAAIKLLCEKGLLEKTRQRLSGQDNRDWVSNFRVVIDETARDNANHLFR